MLGGVKIPHGEGLVGHSDADVALHALTDAILGAISAGDIGRHFPPSDPQWRGAPSALFVDHDSVLPPLPAFPNHNDVFMPTSSCPFRSAPDVGAGCGKGRGDLARIDRVRTSDVQA